MRHFVRMLLICLLLDCRNKRLIFSNLLFPAQTDPLQKAMTAFASALEVPLSKLRFTFDGDLVKPNQTAQELDMENDDVIDARAV